jgi:hypothetical protein
VASRQQTTITIIANDKCFGYFANGGVLFGFGGVLGMVVCWRETSLLDLLILMKFTRAMDSQKPDKL